ncbi:class III lanthipeptide [Lysinibacillus sp. NPDC058147]
MTKLLALQQLDTNISERNTNKSNLSIVCDHGTGSTLSLHFCNSMGNF